ncbi:acetylcholine receptor subunit alpha-type acr-16-like [Bradysia coprophila]|uniref:acetylcholine receptor subunit alpha-type acr-16-like n=1 Tax=Bradysia coprophila TaxID=38358 RepID=UPI00187D82BC|nr:acetylcholine receptor subunit alpha-type acr-16-like [Bradysia coprophila]
MDLNIFLLLFIAALKSSQSEEVDVKNYETLLLNTIFKDYDKRARPVKNHHTPIVVYFDIELHQIIQVDEKHQVMTTNILRYLHWKDEFLQWKPEIYGNITEISTLRGQVWTPDIQLYNSASFDKELDSGSSTRDHITSTGLVSDVIPMVLKSTCKMDVTWFPFDEQKCFLVFGSWTSSSKYLLLQLSKAAHGEISSDYFQEDNGEWNLLGISSNSSSTMYSCCPDDGYIRINYTIHLKRRAFYYFFNLLVPCGLIGFLAILGFTLPPESGEKLPLGATILFSLIVFLNMISESMPANSDTVPLLGTYFNCVMFTIALSVVSTIVINVNLKAANPKRVDGLTKKLFLRWLPRMLRMNISSNIVTEQDAVLWNKKMVKDTFTIQIKRSGGVETVVTFSLHADKIVAQEWSCVAAVVDRMCLVFSLIVTFLSVTIFLVYAY